jgi:hypothetical protein
VVEACRDLLAGRDVDPEIVVALGGPPARWAVDGSTPGPDYWLRVWAARGLLWLWDDIATDAIVTALSDSSWRVREMTAKVVARHQVDAGLGVLLTLRDDPVARVRTAVTVAIQKLTDPDR